MKQVVLIFLFIVFPVFAMEEPIGKIQRLDKNKGLVYFYSPTELKKGQEYYSPETGIIKIKSVSPLKSKAVVEFENNETILAGSKINFLPKPKPVNRRPASYKEYPIKNTEELINSSQIIPMLTSALQSLSIVGIMIEASLPKKSMNYDFTGFMSYFFSERNLRPNLNKFYEHYLSHDEIDSLIKFHHTKASQHFQSRQQDIFMKAFTSTRDMNNDNKGNKVKEEYKDLIRKITDLSLEISLDPKEIDMSLKNVEDVNASFFELYGLNDVKEKFESSYKTEFPRKEQIKAITFFHESLSGLYQEIPIKELQEYYQHYKMNKDAVIHFNKVNQMVVDGLISEFIAQVPNLKN